VFVAIVTAFGSILNRSRQGAGCNGSKRAAGTGHRRLSEADVVKLLQSRANWVSCRVLHCCSVDPGLLKVRLSPGSDGTVTERAALQRVAVRMKFLTWTDNTCYASRST
jgi:hypothetical protein